MIPSSFSTRRENSVEAFGGAARGGEVEIGLIDGDRLHLRPDTAHEGADLGPDSAVFRHVGRQHNGVRAGGERPEHRHRRTDAVETGHVTRRADDAAAPAADDHRLVPQFGPVAFLDRRIKRVAIDVRHFERREFGVSDDARAAAIPAPTGRRAGAESPAIAA